MIDEYCKKLVTDVVDNNPGALRVVTELQWFTDYYKILQYLRDEEITGGKLWAYYKDICGCSWERLGRAVITDVTRIEHEKQKLSPKMPKLIEAEIVDFDELAKPNRKWI